MLWQKKKTKGFQLPAGAVQPLRMEGGNEQGEEQEYQEAIQAVHKLFEGSTVAPSATVQSLMDALRAWPAGNNYYHLRVSIPQLQVLDTFCLLLSTYRQLAIFFQDFVIQKPDDSQGSEKKAHSLQDFH